jgi:hypothetical protein
MELMIQLMWRLGLTLAVVVLMLTTFLAAPSTLRGRSGPPAAKLDPQIGCSFQVPYRLTETNHFLVRVRLNGKGPFNFLVDSGAPALFIATATAKKIGLKPDPAEFWTPVDQLDLEGGIRLAGTKARIEDPFQLVGMNALGLPGASIDGILGFTVLARFRLEIDLTKDRMTWTRLAYEPRDPPVPKQRPGEDGGAPRGIQAMNAIGPLAKGLAFLMGKQPEERQQPRGFLGLVWSEKLGSGQRELVVRTVLGGSPAARGGICSGDSIVRISGHAILGLEDAYAALAEIRSGDVIPLVVRRGAAANARELRLNLTAGEGL